MRALLGEKWSLQQISGRLRLQSVSDAVGMRHLLAGEMQVQGRGGTNASTDEESAAGCW